MNKPSYEALLSRVRRLEAEALVSGMAEESLRQAKAVYEDLYENAPDMFVSVTARSLKIVQCNQTLADNLGVAREELIGRSIFDIYHPDCRENVNNVFVRFLEETGDVRNAVLRLVRKNGEIIFVRVNISAVRNENGRIKYSRSILRDITEIRMAEEALKKSHTHLETRVEARTRELALINERLSNEINERKRMEESLRVARDEAESANRAKTEFLAGMSHELRTPLNAIIGFSEILNNQHFGAINDKQKKYVNNIILSGKRLLFVIENVFILAGIEAGKIVFSPVKVDLKRIVTKSIRDFRDRPAGRRIELTLDFKCENSGHDLRKTPGCDYVKSAEPECRMDEENWIVCADESKLKTILFNLVSNAEKFTPAGGNIRVAVSCLAGGNAQKLLPARTWPGGSLPDGPIVWISITDTGIGIERENMLTIFAPFFQVAGGLTGKTPGTGLGLAITKRFVDMHGGVMWADSQGKNQGTCFHVLLPALGKGLIRV